MPPADKKDYSCHASVKIKSYRPDFILDDYQMASTTSIVEINDLKLLFGEVQVLSGVSLQVNRGETLGIVGESGCGKSVTWLAALGLLPGKARISGSVKVGGAELLGASHKVLEGIRGKKIAMIFQDPSSSLNPVMRIGRQIEEALRLHRGLQGQVARAEARRLLDMVGMPDSARRLNAYPYELSGGQNQRAMIAMALAGQPDLLIADEPTTALDATIQAQILDLLDQLRRETGMGLVLISHDLGAISSICERVAVMYCGRIVEEGTAARLFHNPLHPYSYGLMSAIPSMQGPRKRLLAIPGSVPDPGRLPKGCSFAPRCASALADCAQLTPSLATVLEPGLSGSRRLSCFYPRIAQPITVEHSFDRVA
jgi:peptide/nickel transport system ATP-binding protein